MTMTADATGKASTKHHTRNVKRACLVALLAFILQRQWAGGSPILSFIPNALLFVPITILPVPFWRLIVRYDRKGGKKEAVPIPEILAKDYSYEKLVEATNNFRSPAVVRGLFAGTPATKKWDKPGYLSGKPLGDFKIPVTVNATYAKQTHGSAKAFLTFRDAYEEVLRDKKSVKYLFFPLTQDPDSEKIQELVNTIIKEDMDLDRIFPGFGTKSHETFRGNQFIIGNGRKSSDATTGSGWHCAGVSNWFVQVFGRKRWYFVDPKYSAFFQPIRNGNFAVVTTNPNMPEDQHYIPMKYVDLKSGDMLYNPHWQWHTVKNYDGLAFGVPIRTMEMDLSLRCNTLFATAGFFHFILNKIGFPSHTNVD